MQRHSGHHRRIAAELSCETAFARPLPEGGGADWALRWFTPAAESNVGGHATLATAHALHADRPGPLTVRFASQFGILTGHTRHDGTITLDFPAAVPAEASAPDGLAQAVGAEPVATYSTGALGDLLAVVGDEAAVRYWSHRLGRDSLTGLQASERTGLVHTTVHADRVHLTGHAATILDGTLNYNAGYIERTANRS